VPNKVLITLLIIPNRKGAIQIIRDTLGGGEGYGKVSPNDTKGGGG